MNGAEHYEAAEKALDGAKEMMRHADGMANREREQLQVQTAAGLLLSAASVHARLALASAQAGTWNSNGQPAPRIPPPGVSGRMTGGRKTTPKVQGKS